MNSFREELSVLAANRARRAEEPPAAPLPPDYNAAAPTAAEVAGTFGLVCRDSIARNARASQAKLPQQSALLSAVRTAR